MVQGPGGVLVRPRKRRLMTTLRRVETPLFLSIIDLDHLDHLDQDIRIKGFRRSGLVRVVQVKLANQGLHRRTDSDMPLESGIACGPGGQQDLAFSV